MFMDIGYICSLPGVDYNLIILILTVFPNDGLSDSISIITDLIVHIEANPTKEIDAFNYAI